MNPLLPDPDSVMSLQRRASVWTRNGRCSTFDFAHDPFRNFGSGHALVGRALVIFNTPSATKHRTVTGKMIQFSISQPQAL
jgi:hypothetical protein